MSEIISENKIKRIEIYIPKWVEMLPEDNSMKQQLVQTIKVWVKNNSEDLREQIVKDIEKMPFIKSINNFENSEELEKGSLRLYLSFEEKYYYLTLTDLTGIEITGEYQLISLIRELARKKHEFEEIHEALESVKNNGYGIIRPEKTNIHWEEPVLIQNNNRFGVKMKASGPAIHLIKTDLETEISPIIGNEQQAKDLMEYLIDGAEKSEGIWEINIFGKTVEQLMDDEISSKLMQFSDDHKLKIQQVLHRILDEHKNGIICMII